MLLCQALPHSISPSKIGIKWIEEKFDFFTLILEKIDMHITRTVKKWYTYTWWQTSAVKYSCISVKKKPEEQDWKAVKIQNTEIMAELLHWIVEVYLIKWTLGVYVIFEISISLKLLRQDVQDVLFVDAEITTLFQTDRWYKINTEGKTCYRQVCHLLSRQCHTKGICFPVGGCELFAWCERVGETKTWRGRSSFGSYTLDSLFKELCCEDTTERWGRSLQIFTD